LFGEQKDRKADKWGEAHVRGVSLTEHEKKRREGGKKGRKGGVVKQGKPKSGVTTPPHHGLGNPRPTREEPKRRNESFGGAGNERRLSRKKRGKGLT